MLPNHSVLANECKDVSKLGVIEKYLQIVPIHELMDDMALKVSRTLPKEKRRMFVELMTKKIDMKLIETAMINSMCKHYTFKEIEALNNFYSQPEGRSVMKKMGDYMADLMPVIQSEIMRAAKEMENKQ